MDGCMDEWVDGRTVGAEREKAILVGAPAAFHT